jgi:hypothetical protein
MFSPDKPTGGGVANWQTFFKKGSNMGLPTLEIMRNWMIQACTVYKHQKFGGTFMHQLFTYARFTEEQLQTAIRMCRSESFLQMLPEARHRMIREEMATHDFSHLHFTGPQEEEFSCMGGRRKEEEFSCMGGRQQAGSSGFIQLLSQKIERLECRLGGAEELAQKGHLRTMDAERRVFVAEKRTQEAEKRTQEAEDQARLAQMKVRELERQLADIKKVLSQLGQLFQSNEKPAMSPDSHSNGNSNGNAKDENPPDHLCDMTFSCDVMKDPVIAADGHTHERKSIEEWFANGNQTSPTTGAPMLSFNLIPNYKVKDAIIEWQKRRSDGDRAAVVVGGGGGDRAAVVVGGGGGDRAAVCGNDRAAVCGNDRAAVCGNGRVPFDWDSVPTIIRNHVPGSNYDNAAVAVGGGGGDRAAVCGNGRVPFDWDSVPIRAFSIDSDDDLSDY